MKLPSGPISPKVSGGTLAGLPAAIMTWILTTYIPAFHSGIPPQIQPLVPALVGVIGFFWAGYSSKHKATAAEIEIAMQEAETILGLKMKQITLPSLPLVPASTPDTSSTTPLTPEPAAGGVHATQ